MASVEGILKILEALIDKALLMTLQHFAQLTHPHDAHRISIGQKHNFLCMENIIKIIVRQYPPFYNPSLYITETFEFLRFTLTNIR